jgi:hypothetical protein
MMRKGDYEAVAIVIAGSVAPHTQSAEFQRGSDVTRKAIAESLAILFKAQNPAFNKAKFMTTCGFPSP